MSRLILLFFVVLLSTTIAELQYKDANQLPRLHNCNLNDLNKQLETLKAAISAINWKLDALKEHTQSTPSDLKLIIDQQKDYVQSVSRHLKLFFEKFYYDTQLQMEKEMIKLNARLNELESRQPCESLYQNITSTLKYALVSERRVLSNEFQKANNQIRRDINDLSQTKLLDMSDTLLWDEHFNCLQNCTPIEKLPRSCAEINNNTTGIRLLYIPNAGLQPFYVYCHEDLTIIQRREDGSVNFNKNWHDYKHGFGDLNGEYWLGLERIHALTKDRRNRLKILMADFTDDRRQAEYSDFSIDDENHKYKLKSLGEHRGDAEGDALKYHLGFKFSTFDDDTEERCAGVFKSGWWFQHCYHCNLNGRYLASGNRHSPGGIDWDPWTNGNNSLYFVMTGLVEEEDDDYDDEDEEEDLLNP